jgi:acetyl-CoA C-acetyltransferase
MPYVASIGTHLSCWGTVQHRVAGDAEDAITLAVEDGGVAKQAFSMAGMTPADVDVSEVHDFFTGIELISYEDLGFAERFGAYKLLEAEETTIGGGLPVNTSGGLTATGHPPGATGVAQCVELFGALRGEAIDQVDGARVGLAHNLGGPTAVSAVTILEGPVAHGR